MADEAASRQPAAVCQSSVGAPPAPALIGPGPTPAHYAAPGAGLVTSRGEAEGDLSKIGEIAMVRAWGTPMNANTKIKMTFTFEARNSIVIFTVRVTLLRRFRTVSHDKRE